MVILTVLLWILLLFMSATPFSTLSSN